MRGLRRPQSAVGRRELRCSVVLAMQRSSSVVGCPRLLRSIDHHGRVDTQTRAADAGRGERSTSGLFHTTSPVPGGSDGKSQEDQQHLGGERYSITISDQGGAVLSTAIGSARGTRSRSGTLPRTRIGKTASRQTADSTSGHAHRMIWWVMVAAAA